jgi:hypothetical protein
MSKLSQNSSSSTEMLGSFSATRITLIVVGGAIVIGIAYFGIIKPVFEFVGIKDSKEDKENKETVEQGLKKPYWNPNFWRNNPNRLSYPESKYVSMAQQLYDATRGGFFGWGTAEEAIYGVFRQLPTSFDVSKLADVYQISHSEDFYQMLNDELDTEEFAILQTIINNTAK